MERNKYNPDSRGGGYGWVAVGALVTAYDVFAPETLSNSFRRGTESESAAVRAGVYGLGALTVAHLLDVIPERFDPIDNFAAVLGKAADRLADWSTEGVHIP